MPTEKTVKKARQAAREGERPSTQAGPFVEAEMRRYKKGSGNVRSRKQAIAIGLSEARRAGVKLGVSPGGGSGPARKKARYDTAVGSGQITPSPTRSRGAQKAARTRERKYGRS